MVVVLLVMFSISPVINYIIYCNTLHATAKHWRQKLNWVEAVNPHLWACTELNWSLNVFKQSMLPDVTPSLFWRQANLNSLELSRSSHVPPVRDGVRSKPRYCERVKQATWLCWCQLAPWLFHHMRWFTCHTKSNTPRFNEANSADTHKTQCFNFCFAIEIQLLAQNAVIFVKKQV